MKHKWKIPILLLAAVIMLSIFYIMDGNNKQPNKPVSGTDYIITNLNPEFTESRIQAYNVALEEIGKLEDDIAKGNLSPDEVNGCVAKIDDIKQTKALEVSLEEAMIEEFALSDALVVVDKKNKEIVIDVYAANNDISLKERFIEVALLALEMTELNYQVKLLDN